MSRIARMVTACTIPASGVRPPARTLVAVLAMAPVAGSPPIKGETMCALSEQLRTGAMATADHAVRHNGRKKRLNRGEEGD